MSMTDYDRDTEYNYSTSMSSTTPVNPAQVCKCTMQPPPPAAPPPPKKKKKKKKKKHFKNYSISKKDQHDQHNRTY